MRFFWVVGGEEGKFYFLSSTKTQTNNGTFFPKLKSQEKLCRQYVFV